MIPIETAQAAEAGGAAGGGMVQLLFIGAFILIIYFLMIRPQSKRRKEHQALVSGLSLADEVITAGGIVGRITEVEDNFVKIKVSDGVEIRMQRTSVSATLPKGTLKTLDSDAGK